MRTAELIASTPRWWCWGFAAAVTLVASAGRSQTPDPVDPSAAPPPPGTEPANPAGAAPAPAGAAPLGGAYGPNFVPAPGTKLEGYLPSSSQSKSDIYQPDGFDLKRPSGSTPTLRGDPDNL